MAVQWLHAAQAPVRPRHCTQALLQQPDQLILSNTLPRPAARALFSLRLHSVSIAFRLCASSGERSARLRRLDWVSSAFATSLFEGVSSARLRRFDSFFRSLRRAASLCVVGMMGPKCEREGIGQNVVTQTSDRHHTFCVTIYWGCCAGCTL